MKTVPVGSIKDVKRMRYFRKCPYFGTVYEVTCIWRWNGSRTNPLWELTTTEVRL